MKKYLILLPLIALALTGFFVMPVSAHMTEFGQNFGQHIATITPEHPIMHGAMFGNMVSNMARNMPCH